MSSPRSPQATVEIVDPEKAKKWLGVNLKNRSLRLKTKVSVYAHDMARGRWQFTGEPIKFSSSGKLLDGQHRLHAVIQAEVTIPMLVVWDLADESQEVMDTGAKRTASDALALRGEKSTAALAAAASSVLTQCSGTQRNISTSDILEMIEADPAIRWIVTDVLPGLKLNFLSSTVAFYSYWRLNQIDPERTKVFFESLSSLANLPPKSPILALHKRISAMNSSRVSKGHPLWRQEAVASIFTAWNA